MLEGIHIHKKYGNLEVLKGISLQVQEGEIVSIVGSSGAGKSTLLHILGTLDQADSGQVILDKTELTELPSAELSKVRNEKIGFVFQFHNLMAELTAEENICLPAWIGNQPDREIKNRARELMQLLNIEGRADHLPSEMSGGEQQRVAVARALINHPKYVFADEPSGNLDTKNAAELHELFFKLRDNLGCSFIIVTHNLALAERSDRIIELKDGAIVA